mgnify:CR=1 FL=1
MGRTKKAAVPPESAQEERDGLGLGTDTPQAQTDETELLEGLLAEYAVTAAGGLNLRDGPRLDAAVAAVLPQGAGVYSYGEAKGGWLRVKTGRLEGWMLSRHLEELPLPELSAYGAD